MIDTAPTLVVLAAGLGTRYGALKQLDPVGPGDTTLMDYALADAARAGFSRAVIVVREEIEADIVEHLRRTVGSRLPWSVARQRLDDLPAGRPVPPERAKPWGTVHAVLAARDRLPGPFAVANADDHYGRDAYRVLHDHLSGAAGRTGAWALAGYRLGDTLSPHGAVNRGVCRLDGTGELEHVVEVKGLRRCEDGRVTGHTEAGEPLVLSGDETVSMNLWAFTLDAVEWLEAEMARFLDERGGEPGAECLLPGAVQAAIHAGVARVRVPSVEGDCFGVTHPEDRPAVVRRLAERGDPWGAEL